MRKRGGQALPETTLKLCVGNLPEQNPIIILYFYCHLEKLSKNAQG